MDDVYIYPFSQSNQYATISDAISKLNFSQALLDANCYPFICKVYNGIVKFVSNKQRC